MGGKYLQKTILLLFLSSLLLNSVSAATMKSDDGGFTVTYPDNINVFEPITLHFEVSDKELIKNTDFIYGEFSIPLTEGEGFEHHSDLTADGLNHYLYKGEKSFDIVISLLRGSLDLNTVYSGKEDPMQTVRQFVFHSDEDGVLDMIDIPFTANQYDFDVKDIPGGFVQDKKDLNTLTAVYAKEGEGMTNHLSISMSSYNYNFHDEQKLLSKNEIMNEVPVPEGWTKETFTVDGNPAYLTTFCSISGWEKDDKYNGECSFSGEIFFAIGRLSFDMRRYDHESKPKAAIEAEVEKWKSDAREAIQNIIMDGGKTSGMAVVEEKEEDDGECETDLECSEDKVCNACGECAAEDEVYGEDEVSLEDVSFKTEFTSKKVLNKIDSLIIARVSPVFKIVNSDGKKISYCDMRQGSFKNLVLHGEIKEEDRYSGFTSGMLYDDRDRTRDRVIDLSEENPKIAFFISPNDREKYVGEIKDIKEHVAFTLLNQNDKLYEDEYEYILEAYDSGIEVKTSSKQMQQDSSKAIAFTVKNKFAKDVVVKVKLFGIGGIEEGDPSIKHTVDDEIVTRKSFFDSFKPNKEYKFVYYSPELGNADIGESLAGLSMMKLQKEGATASAIDSLTLGAGHGMEEGAKAISAAEKTSVIALAGAKKYFKAIPGAYSADKAAKVVQDLNYIRKYRDNFKKVKDIVDTGNQLYGLSQVYGASSSALKGYEDMKDDVPEKSWAEKVGEAGVTGINGLQGAVGGAMLVVGKVPGFGPLGQAVFSWTTNIWKANFQYIASSEKIDRIQELFWPNIIMIEASDESGWTTRSLLVVKVAYHQI